MFLLLQCPCYYKILASVMVNPTNLPPPFQPPKAPPSHHLTITASHPHVFSFLLKYPTPQSLPLAQQEGSDTFPNRKLKFLSQNNNIWRKTSCPWEQPATRTRRTRGGEKEYCTWFVTDRKEHTLVLENTWLCPLPAWQLAMVYGLLCAGESCWEENRGLQWQEAACPESQRGGCFPLSGPAWPRKAEEGRDRGLQQKASNSEGTWEKKMYFK